MPTPQTLPPSLEAPFSHQYVLEDSIRQSFPAVWHKLYYYNPKRNRDPKEEANIVYTLVQQDPAIKISRNLQNFNHKILWAVKNGHGVVIALSLNSTHQACYLMTEHNISQNRLTNFFGEANLKGQNLKLTARLFEEFVARHELYHSVELLEPDFAKHQPTALQSESGADAYAILSSVRDYGDIVLPFAKNIINARNHQQKQNANLRTTWHYATQNTLNNTLSYIQEKGLKAIENMDNKSLFTLARQLSLNP